MADEIRTAIATPRARAALEAAIEAMEEVMTDYGQDYTDWEFKREEDDSLKQPEQPDLEALCEELGLAVIATPLIDEYTLRDDYTAGESTQQVEVDFRGFTIPQQMPIWNFAFQESRDVFEPFRTSIGLEFEFISWKTSERES